MNRGRKTWFAQIFGAVAALAAALLSPLEVSAGPFPEKPIHFVVPNPPGTATDQLARTVALTVTRSTPERNVAG